MAAVLGSSLTEVHYDTSSVNRGSKHTVELMHEENR